MEQTENNPFPPAFENRRADAQYDFDVVYQAIRGERAPPPMVAESSGHYRRRMLAPLLKYSTDWKGKDVWKIAPDVLDIADKQIRADAYRIGSDPSLMQELEGTGSRLRFGCRDVGRPSALVLRFGR
jgi:hypothetical protein